MVRIARILLACLAAGLVAGAAPADVVISVRADLVAIPGGAFIMGDVQGEPDEPVRTVRVAPSVRPRFGFPETRRAYEKAL